METPPPQPSRVKKFFLRAVFVLAALITLAGLLVAEENWRGIHAWKNYKSTMEAKGEKFDVAHLIPPKVPDDENFAACPYLAHAFTGSPGWTNIASYLPKSNSAPHRIGWPYGLSSDLTDWAAAFQGEAAAEKMDSAQAARVVLDHLKVCEPVLTELRAASLRRYCRFNVPYEEWASPQREQAADVTLKHLEMFKGLCRVLALHAKAQLATGQTDEALADINLMFRLDDGLKDEPLLINQLVRYASVSVLLQPVAVGLAEHRWSDTQLRALQERLGQTDLLASTIHCYYGERDICWNSGFNGGLMPVRGWDRLEQLNGNRAFQEVLMPRINFAGRVIEPAVSHACDLALSNYTGHPFIHHSVLAGMLMPGIDRSPEKTASAQTEVDLVTVACALERYRLAEGAYPDQLQVLTPRFIPALPHDIINGQPLKYRRTSNGKFVLYSVGWNEKDDGGVVATKKDGSPDREHGDWVFAYPD